MKEKLVEMIKSKGFQIGSASVLSAALSGVAGYTFANKRLSKKYEQLADQEIADAKVFYSSLNEKNQEPYPSPEDILKQKHGADALSALRSYQGTSENSTNDILDSIEEDVLEAQEELEEELHEEIKNIFEEARNQDAPDVTDGFDYQAELARRSGDKPFIITHDEYFESGNDYEQVTLTYFEGDDVLSDERDQPVDDTDGTVGDDNLTRFGHGSKDNNIVYVRNTSLEIDFEIVRSTGRYAKEVLGFDEIEHSDRPGLRKFRRYDE